KPCEVNWCTNFHLHYYFAELNKERQRPPYEV
nr:hypothetical protein [Tanacetum cinerariifolium]